MGRAFWLLVAALAMVAAPGAAPAQQPTEEEVTVETIPADAAKIYLADIAINHIVDGRLYVLNAEDLGFLGLIGTGFAGTIYVPHHDGEIYVATTYSRN
jgi:methylamine dehydrogenase heavy chain